MFVHPGAHLRLCLPEDAPPNAVQLTCLRNLEAWHIDRSIIEIGLAASVRCCCLACRTSHDVDVAACGEFADMTQRSWATVYAALPCNRATQDVDPNTPSHSST